MSSIASTPKRRALSTLAVPLVVVAGLAACNTAQSGRNPGANDPAPTSSPNIDLQMNSWQATGPFLTMDANCKLVGVGNIRILKAPSHGTVRVVERTGTPLFAAGHRLERCNTRKHPGPTVFYRPKPGFVGEDTYTYEVVFRDGERRVISPVLFVNEGDERVRSPRLYGIRS
jgi:hypothetical protein